MSGAFLIGFAVLGGAIDADIEDHATSERRERGLLSEGFGEGLGGALGLRVQIFLHDGSEGCSGAMACMQHVDCWRELISDWSARGWVSPTWLANLPLGACWYVAAALSSP